MRTVTATSLATGNVTTFRIPTVDEALKHSKKTWGSSYDPVERTHIKGMVAMLWEMVDAPQN